MYQFGNPIRPPIEEESTHVKAENDWTSKQLARFPDQFRGFCGVNPLKDYAIANFDASGVARLRHWVGKTSLIDTRILHIGVGRILYDSDGAGRGNLTPREARDASS